MELLILFLDIAWTYFLMQNMDHFKDAAWRLDQAEKMLKNSHGPNQERLIAVKGGACPEMVIYARLFLLQAIVAYHSQSTSRTPVQTCYLHFVRRRRSRQVFVGQDRRED